MSGSGVGLAPVPVHDVEMSPDRSTRTLKHLIRANHVNYSIAVEGKDQEQGDGSSKLNQTSQVRSDEERVRTTVPSDANSGSRLCFSPRGRSPGAGTAVRNPERAPVTRLGSFSQRGRKT